MNKIITFPDYEIIFSFVGLGKGLNFSKRHEPEEADANIWHLRHPKKVTSSTRIIPLINYEAHISTPNGDKDIASAAIITSQFYDALVLLPADCIPIVLANKTGPPVCALIHAGRRELDADIIVKTATLIQKKCRISPHNLYAYLGPGIKKQSYRLPLTIIESLRHDGWQPFITTTADHVCVDTYGFAIRELMHVGIDSRSISVSTVNTVTSTNYFSYYGQTRLAQNAGVNGCVVYMRPRSDLA